MTPAGIRLFAVATLGCVFAALPAGQGQPAKLQARGDFSQVEALIRQRIDKEHIPSVTVAIARNGEILWEKGFGWANREKQLAANENSMYSVASVTKLMTASAIMVLRDRKKIDLDRTVNDYLGPAKLTSTVWSAKDATVRRVANHTSGLATYDNGYACRDGADDCQDVMIRRFGVLIWKPGERFDYSNLGYGVLGDVIRHVSGMKYADFLKSQILSPLEMTHCSVGIAAGLEAFEAQRYNGSDKTPADWSANEPSSQEGASSVFCSAHDLLRFGMFHLKEEVGAKNAVLSSAALDEMQNSPVPADEGYKYGFGWWHEDRFGYKVMYVAGGNEYAQALLFTVPSEKVVVVVLMNMGHPTLTQEVADEAVSAIVPGYRDARAKASGHEDHSSAKPANTMGWIAGTWSGSVQTDVREVRLILTVDSSGVVHAAVEGQPARVEDKAEYHDGHLLAKISGPAGLYERDAKKTFEFDLELFLRSPAAMNGGATTVPLSQPEW